MARQAWRFRYLRVCGNSVVSRWENSVFEQKKPLPQAMTKWHDHAVALFQVSSLPADFDDDTHGLAPSMSPSSSSADSRRKRCRSEPRIAVEVILIRRP